MVVFIFALQIAAFLSHARFIQLDTQLKSLEKLCIKIGKQVIRTPMSNSRIFKRHFGYS